MEVKVASNLLIANETSGLQFIMIILKIGIICRFILPTYIRTKSSKIITFIYYSLFVPLLIAILFKSFTSQPLLFHQEGSILPALVLALWIPTIYARYQRIYWNIFSTYSIIIALLLFFLMMVFSSSRIITLFIFFELSLVPVILILFIGGRSKGKLEAGLYMFFFTSSSAFIFLIFLILRRLSQNGEMLNLLTRGASFQSSFIIRGSSNYRSKISFFIYNATTMIMLVKTPLFFLHMWLPKAHVEAPVFTSMVLASLLLKTGGFGYLVLSSNYFGVLGSIFCASSFVITLAILAAARCRAQKDLKGLIAYSSVNHMAVILCGILFGLSSSIFGRVLVMVGHGVISSALFYLASITYNQMGTRSSFFRLTLSKSNINSLFWILLSVINAGLPPFIIFSGEILIMKAAFSYPHLMFLFLVNYILVGYYTCLLMTKVVLSKFSSPAGSLNRIGLPPFKRISVILMHLTILLTWSLTFPRLL